MLASAFERWRDCDPLLVLAVPSVGEVMKKRTEYAWCIESPGNGLLYGTLRTTRQRSIESLLGADFPGKPRNVAIEWKFELRVGYRAVRVALLWDGRKEKRGKP